MPHLAIIAALPRELATLARALRATRVRSSAGILVQTAPLGATSDSILLITAGMGAHRASLAFASALAHGPVHTLLSVGLAGACDPNVKPGSVLEPNLVIDSRSGERFTPRAHLGIAAPGTLVTASAIASPSEKSRLRQTYNAAAVDMEAATVARLARAHGIPFAALKAISDEHTVDLTHLTHFTGSQGNFRTAAFVLHTALRPHRWRSTAQLGSQTKTALNMLTSAIHQFIATHLSEQPLAPKRTPSS